MLMLWIIGPNDGAFEDLAKQGNQPTAAANDVRNYFTDYFNSDHHSVEWQVIAHKLISKYYIK